MGASKQISPPSSIEAIRRQIEWAVAAYHSGEWWYAGVILRRDQVPALFRMISLSGVNLDIGGGRFDRVEEEYKVFTNLVYDPYNRDAEHNRRVLRLADRGVDSVTIANVLNVLKTEGEILSVLRLADSYGTPIFISIYEGDKSGILKRTRCGWQRNERVGVYLDRVREVRPKAYLKKGVIYA